MPFAVMSNGLLFEISFLPLQAEVQQFVLEESTSVGISETQQINRREIGKTR